MRTADARPDVDARASPLTSSGPCVMPTDAEPCLLDTSAAVALVVAGHDHHAATLAALDRRELGLCGHATFETYSVLTRLPWTQRLSPAVAHRVPSTNSHPQPER